MESPDLSPPHVDASRPSLGFPLGTALLLIVVFSLSGIFSCCYHWDKLRSLRGAYPDDHDSDDPEDPPAKSNLGFTDSNKQLNLSMPVLMPGDDMPKFIALPCPCQPPREEKVVLVKVEVVENEPPPPPPPKEPRIAVPLY